MFDLLQRRNSAELVLTMESPDDPEFEAFMTRFDISKTCVWAHSFLLNRLADYVLFHSQEAGSIAQLADSEFAPSPPHPRTPTPLTPDAYHDAPMAPPPDSPMSDALTPPSPLPPDVEMNPVAPEEDHSSDLGDLQLPSSEISLQHVDEPSLELELPDEDPPLPLVGDVDHSEDTPVDPSITSPECTPTDTGSDTGADMPQPEDIEDITAPSTPMETDSDQLAAEITEEPRPEALVSPSIVEETYLQEDTDMDVDAVGEPHVEPDESITPIPEREHSATPPAPTAPQTEVESLLSPVAYTPVVALPPSAFMLPPKTEVFIPVKLAPVGEPPQYALDLTSPEARSLTVNEWLSPEFSLSRKYTLPPVKSLPLDQQRRLKLGKNQRKKEKEKDKGTESRKDAEDWTPMGINKWGVTIKSNPLWKRVSRATKTMSTRDWNVSPLLYADYRRRPHWRLGGF